MKSERYFNTLDMQHKYILFDLRLRIGQENLKGVFACVCVASQLWNGGQKGKEDQVDPKPPGGEWLKMKGKQLDGSHGRMSEPSRQTVVVGKRMSKPYVPYGIKRYRIGFACV